MALPVTAEVGLAEPVIEAAGGVVFRRRKDGTPEHLVVHRPRYDDWTLPKGKLDTGESYKHCARREVLEETGLVVELRGQIGTVAYETSAGHSKRVRYWLMESVSGSFTANDEVDSVEWLRPRKTRARLTYSRDRAVFDRGAQLVKRPRSGRIYLVRHALAGDRSQWNDSDRKRPLSKRGWNQAHAIRDALTVQPITRLMSSMYLRCRDTLAPLSDIIAVDVENHAALLEAAKPSKLVDLVASLGGSTTVMSTHGDVIEAYIEHLAREGARLEGPMRWKKGSIWVIETRKGRVREARYMPPPQ